MSAAQRCNEYVLLDILGQVQRRDLAAAALVCHSWLPAAQSLLYRRVEFDLQSRTVSKLEDTLRTCPHLREQVRHLKLHREWLGPTYVAGLTWIDMLPAHSLLSVEFAFFTEVHRLDDILKYSAIRTAPQIIIRSANFTTSARLGTVLNLPDLTSLSLACGLAQPTIMGTLKLKRLSILSTGLPDVIFRIIGAIDPSCALERFDLATDVTLDAEQVESVLDALGPHLASLKHLYLASRVQLTDNAFMDDLVTRLDSLKTVYCGYGSYTSTILTRLPPTVRCLGLVWGLDGATLTTGRVRQEHVLVPRRGNVPFPYHEFAEAVTDYHHWQGSRSSLERLILVRPELVRDDAAVLEEACRAAGIGFEIVHMNDSFVRMLE